MTTISAINPLAPVTPPPEKHIFALSTMTSSPQAVTSAPSPQLKRKAVEPPLPSPAELTTQSTQQAARTAQPAMTQTTSAETQPNPNAAMDPKYLAMVSRIASYYQQRCQAVINFQQQRCQAWANMHRQKCQETTQAAMLVVAWYVRDRIQRRRRRQKTKFRSGLKQRKAVPKVTRGEVVRRWVMQVPQITLPPNTVSMERMADKEEASFSMDKETTPDRDSKLLETADNLIKSQYKKIDVPLLGILNFDESDYGSGSDSSSESGDEEADGANLDEEGEDDMDDEDFEDDDLYDEEDMILDDDGDEETGSEVVHNGTGHGSRHKNRSSSS